MFHKFPSKKGPNLLLQQQTFLRRQEVLERAGQGDTDVGQLSEVLPVPYLTSNLISPGREQQVLDMVKRRQANMKDTTHIIHERSVTDMEPTEGG